jgi:hypothetical protein
MDSPIMDPGLLLTQATVAYYVSHVLEWLKHATWCRLLEPQMKRAQRWVSIAVAVLAAIGITYSFDPAAGQLVISGLTLDAIGRALVQFALQEIAYTKFVQPPKNGGTT